MASVSFRIDLSLNETIGRLTGLQVINWFIALTVPLFVKLSIVIVTLITLVLFLFYSYVVLLQLAEMEKKIMLWNVNGG